MKKLILNLAGAKQLTKSELKAINGGRMLCKGTLIPTPKGDLCGCCSGISTYFYSSFPACCC